jgi:hypothetical protein
MNARTRIFGVLMAFLPVVGIAEWRSDGTIYRRGKFVSGPVDTIWTKAPDRDAEFLVDCQRYNDERSPNLHMMINRGSPHGTIRERAEPSEYVASVSFDGGPSRRLHLRAKPSPVVDQWMWAAVDDEEFAGLIRDLRAHDRMTVLLANGGGRGTTTLDFDVRGFEKAFRPLKGCRMPSAGGRR